MLLDAFVYLLTFLGSMEIRGVENLGIIWSIVTSVLGQSFYAMLSYLSLNVFSRTTYSFP